MNGRTALDRLAAARPAVLGNTELIADQAEQERILLQVLASGPRPLPHGTAGEHQPGHRRRPGRSRLAVAATCTAVIATAAVLTLAAAPGNSPRHHTPATQGATVSAATLAYRTSAAVSTATRTGIFYTRTVFSHGTAGRTTMLQEWGYGNSVREESFAAGHAPVEKASMFMARGTLDQRLVDYTSRTWSQHRVGATESQSTPAEMTLVVKALLTPHATIKYTTVPGGKRIIEVTRAFPYGDSGAVQLPPVPGFTASIFTPRMSSDTPTITVWIDAASYLPVREMASGPGGNVLATQTFAWLPLTAENLTQVRSPVPVPNGFRQVR